MFTGIKHLWREARADVIQKQATDLLDRYERSGGYEQYEFWSAFDSIKDQLESDHDELSAWQNEDKAAVATLHKSRCRASGPAETGAPQ